MGASVSFLAAVDALVSAIQSGEWDDLHSLADRVEELRPAP